MKFIGSVVFLILCFFLFVTVGEGALSVSVGSHYVPPGTNRIQIPITISGGDLVTDMVGAIQIGDGGPLVGGRRGPRITAVSYAGSIWSPASGGFFQSATVTLPAEIYDPNISLNAAGQRVTANGLLMTLTVDVTDLPVGIFELKLACGIGPDTGFQNSGTNVPATIHNGLLIVGPNATATNASPLLRVASAPGGGVALSFSTEMGRNYRIQWTRDFGAWTELPSNIAGTGCEVSWKDDGSGLGQAPAVGARRFYRVRALPVEVAPRLVLARGSNGAMRITFPTQAGRRYRIQWSSVDGVWTEIPADIQGNAYDVIWTDDGTVTGQSPATAGLRFYRVRVMN